MASLPVNAPKMFDNSMIVIVKSLNCFVEFSQKEIFKDANVEKNDWFETKNNNMVKKTENKVNQKWIIWCIFANSNYNLIHYEKICHYHGAGRSI